MTLLLFLSVISWAIMINKYFKTKKIAKQADSFLREFRRRRNLDDAYNNTSRYAEAPFAGLLHSAYDEIKSITNRMHFSNPNPSLP